MFSSCDFLALRPSHHGQYQKEEYLTHGTYTHHRIFCIHTLSFIVSHFIIRKPLSFELYFCYYFLELSELQLFSNYLCHTSSSNSD